MDARCQYIRDQEDRLAAGRERSLREGLPRGTEIQEDEEKSTGTQAPNSAVL